MTYDALHKHFEGSDQENARLQTSLYQLERQIQVVTLSIHVIGLKEWVWELERECDQPGFVKQAEPKIRRRDILHDFRAGDSVYGLL